ncbi:MAG: DUF1592 domain-containing protein [Archangium sp.]
MRRALPFLLIAVTGCEATFLPGEGGGPGGFDPEKPVIEEVKPIVTACTDSPTPGTAPLRRLSHEEYRNIITDLFGDEALSRNVTKDFISDPISLGFTNSARFLDVKLVMAQEYMKAAEALAARSVTSANLPTIAPCHATGDEACARAVIDTVVHKLYRRALTTDEVNKYLAIYRQGRMNTNFATGVEWMLLAAFQSPNFLYRPEVEGSLEQRAVAPYELANRLSFFLWRSMPDEALLTAAETGKLVTRADVEREARRMLTDEKADRVFEFFEQWLDIDELPSMARNPTAFPGLSPTLANELREEARQYVKHTVLEDGVSLQEFLTAQYTWVNGSLANHYNLSGVTGSQYQKVSWTSGKRGGLFMLSGSLVSHDKQTRTSIVNRGLRVRTLLLCQTVPSPPDDVPLSLGPIDATASQGDRLAAHRTNASCAGCHSLLDPLGEPFETIDAVGRERTIDEGGHTIKTEGSIVNTTTVNGKVADGMDLMNKLAAAPEVQECFVRQLFRFGNGRIEEDADLCSRQRALESFTNSDFNVKELFVAMTQTDDFLFKAAVTQ